MVVQDPKLEGRAVGYSVRSWEAQCPQLGGAVLQLGGTVSPVCRHSNPADRYTDASWEVEYLQLGGAVSPAGRFGIPSWEIQYP